MTVIGKTRANLVAREVALPSPHTCCYDTGKKETKMTMDCCYLFLSCLAWLVTRFWREIGTALTGSSGESVTD